jgi:lipopolysaccharide transport system permease protein
MVAPRPQNTTAGRCPERVRAPCYIAALVREPHADGAPVVRIRATRRPLLDDLRETWSHRELLYFLGWRDIKVRYKQTALGVTWALLQPVLSVALFSWVFGRLVRIPSDGVPYPLFALSGMLLWTFVANTLNASANSLVSQANLITKVYFPRMIVPAAAVGAGLFDLVLSMVVLGPMLLYYQIPFHWSQLLVALPFALCAALCLTLGTLVAALTVRYRDLRHALPFAIQIWMFLSPVIYPSSLVGERWRWVYSLNPLTGILESSRAFLFGGTPDWAALGTAAIVLAGLVPVSTHVFRRLEAAFADVA